MKLTNLKEDIKRIEELNRKNEELYLHHKSMYEKSWEELEEMHKKNDEKYKIDSEYLAFCDKYCPEVKEYLIKNKIVK